MRGLSYLFAACSILSTWRSSQPAPALDAQAQSWHIPQIWSASIAASDALLGDAPLPMSVRLWARNLVEVRDRTVSETHIRRFAAPFWALPWPLATAELTRVLIETVLPSPSDSWSTKLGRTRESWRSRNHPSEEHIDRLGVDARRDPRVRRKR
jgi:hypothetical protein